ncbi:RHS repeat-associated core domain-containing protein [Pseudomonas soli]|uniref:RHS repeat-associated core domain-containing protein n=1 Tax=Pseudomonas soli TaxID=1306993 RepID=UPI003818CE8A
MSRSLNTTVFFYLGNRLFTAKQYTNHRSIFHIPDRPLAEYQSADQTGLLATDDKGSVLIVQGKEEIHSYSAYGYTPTLPSVRTLLGFNGEVAHTVIDGYLLGNGYRLYVPTLYRFCSPDSLSPFSKNNLNAYSYCEGDPINYTDPSGHLKMKVLSYPERGSRKPIALPSSSSNTYYLITGNTADGNIKHQTTLVQTKLSFEQPISIYILHDSLPDFRKQQKNNESSSITRSSMLPKILRLSTKKLCALT